jgi:hypothetical protein
MKITQKRIDREKWASQTTATRYKTGILISPKSQRDMALENHILSLKLTFTMTVRVVIDRHSD